MIHHSGKAWPGKVARSDRLGAGAGYDMLDGGPGNDILDGGPGADAFVVTPTSGNDVVAGGFTPGPGAFDHIAFEEILPNQVSVNDTPQGVLVSWGSGSILLEGIQKGQTGAGRLHVQCVIEIVGHTAFGRASRDTAQC